MPATADPDLALRLAKATADLYGDAASILLRKVADRLARGVDQPGWAEAKLLETAALRGEAQAVVRGLAADMPSAVEGAVNDGILAGQADAVADLDAVDVRTAFTGTNSRAVSALVNETVTNLASSHAQILRRTVDAYRSIIAEASAGPVIAGAESRRAATQRALNRFADHGIVGFTDRAGRSWEIESYAEMATRTAVGRAQVQGTLERFEQAGRNLVIVSDAPQECATCRPFEGKVLSIVPHGGYPTVAEATAQGLLHANCFPGDVLVSGPPVVAADARRFVGDLVVIHTAGGDELPVTPNHPVLTAKGWVAAGALHVGDQLVRHLWPERMNLVGPHHDGVPARISEVHRALEQASTVGARLMPASAEQFHGDGKGGQISVVLADGELRDGVHATTAEPDGHPCLIDGGRRAGALLAERSALQVLNRPGRSADGIVSGGYLGGSLCWRHGGPLPALGFAAPELGSTHPDPAGHAGLGEAEAGRQLILSLAGSVALDEVVDLGRRKFAGHVYNLQTTDGWYTTSGLIVHNCRHRLGLYVPGLTKRLTDTADPEGDEARQRQRALERNVRRWKRREAAAISPSERTQARARRIEASRRLGDHVDAHDLKRLRSREQIGRAR